jgi:hypothetical protein
MTDNSSDRAPELVTITKLTRSVSGGFGRLESFAGPLQQTFSDDIKKRETAERLMCAELDLARREMRVYTFDGFRR